MNNQYPAETLLCVEELRESYGDVAVLDGNNFEVNRGEFVCIVGPSGSGKTTLLRSIAGLQPPTSGKTVFEGQEVTEPPAKLAVVFQDYSRSLLPWMSVADNVALPLKGKGSKQEIATRVDQALVSVGLAGRGKVHPWQMSGGMQQRAAIARDLAYNPHVLLMDEPFAAVDAQTHIELEDLVLRLRDEYNTTVLFVTHDIDEAVYLADRVLVLSGAPTKVTENIRTELPNPRNQLETKRLDRFGEVREQVFTLIQNAKSHASI
ncbi:ABC transporter ATP-binding protein [Glutamicibacter sp. MCAF14]|uniref:ABC transporter ATP-binding protein n=1 Tax=Glutamicibacter sp. MCAF14 TaxID=3233043 RepID=UPI003F924D4B